jgi:hypothetical protein
MHDITPPLWCWLAQADVFCARNIDVFQCSANVCDPNTARRQGYSARSYGDLFTGTQSRNQLSEAAQVIGCPSRTPLERLSLQQGGSVEGSMRLALSAANAGTCIT